MTVQIWPEIALSFLGALFVGTFAEYVAHRFMHAGVFLLKTHADHHQSNDGQGWFGEFLDYLFPSLPLLAIGFLYSVLAGVGFAIGGVCYAAIAAYAHQLQHERPELVFWMRIPVHHAHHEHKMWRHNFGITVSFWDHVFRTYKKVDWQPKKRPFDYPLRQFLRIQWF